MSATLRLLRIEARRSLGLWLLLAAPILIWFAFLQGLPRVAPLWFETSVMVRNLVTFAGPLLAGAAAWMAGRDRRRGIEDLLATTPRPAFARTLATWAGATAWGVLIYVAIGGGIMALSWLRATWGGPFVGPLLVGLVAIPTHAALGFALGRYFPSRFTAPLVTVALFFGQLFVGAQNAWYAFLSPMVSLNTSVWYGVRPDLTLQQVFFLLGLIGLLLASLPLRDQRNRAAGGASCLAAALVTVAGVAIIWHDAPPRGGQDLSRDERFRNRQVIPYQPVCRDAPMPVCVHPAYQPYLDETTAVINRLVAPVVGLPGVPTRAEQGYPAITGNTDATTLWFDIQPQAQYWEQLLTTSVLYPLTTQVVFMPADGNSRSGSVRNPCPSSNPGSCADAQQVIMRWLLRQTGLADDRYQVGPRFTDPAYDRITPTVERFAALDPAQQQKWLRAHFADLRAGKVRLEDLP